MHVREAHSTFQDSRLQRDIVNAASEELLHRYKSVDFQTRQVILEVEELDNSIGFAVVANQRHYYKVADVLETLDVVVFCREMVLVSAVELV